MNTKYSILRLFQDVLSGEPDRPLLTFVDEQGRDESTLTAGGLAAGASRVAGALAGWGLGRGDHVLLVYPPSPDFTVALLGCLAAGVIPVPVCPPDPLRPRVGVPGFAAIVDSCGAKAALTVGKYERARTLGAVNSLLGGAAPRWPKLSWHRTDRRRFSMAERVPTAWREPESADEPALLQYTSGSTGDPRGVVITHGNLYHEVRANAADLGLDRDTRGVFWVPHYHDLGLINVILSAVVGNGHCWLLSPLAFLKRPAVWFDVMSRVGATHTAAPNFAYDLAVRRTTPQQRAGWDLGALRVAMVAAEPIRPTTMRDFYDAFAVSGLDPDSYFPAYGLAEHTVSVTMGGRVVLRVNKGAAEAGRVEIATATTPGRYVEYAGCGQVTKPHARVRIVDPTTRRACAVNQIGEIWVDSATKAAGYFGLGPQTAETFDARVAEEDDPRRYLRTGDLGFFHGGELFVTGRIKDLIIIRGRNVHPQDLEASVRHCHPLIRPGGLAAFSIGADAVSAQDGAPGASGVAGERIVLFVEVGADRLGQAEAEQIARSARAALAEDHQLTSHAVLVGGRGLVRKTTSGKLSRQACRTAFLDAKWPDGTFLILQPVTAESNATPAGERG